MKCQTPLPPIYSASGRISRRPMEYAGLAEGLTG